MIRPRRLRGGPRYVAALFIFCLMMPASAGERAIRDNLGNRAGSIKDGVIRDNLGNRTGSIRDGVIRDTLGNRVGEIRRDRPARAR